jgi:hypothetical protein
MPLTLQLGAFQIVTHRLVDPGEDGVNVDPLGSAATFEEARVEFEAAWRVFLAKRTEDSDNAAGSSVHRGHIYAAETASPMRDPGRACLVENPPYLKSCDQSCVLISV